LWEHIHAPVPHSPIFMKDTKSQKRHGKTYNSKIALRTEATYSVSDACELLPKLSTTKFDGSAEMHIRIFADTTQADQLVRTTVSLPHGTGKKVRIAAFVPDNLIDEAKKAGAHIAGNEDLVKTINDGTIDFDVAVAHPDMMKELGKIAKTLGQKGLMPNPKAGTVSADIAKTISELSKGRIECKMDSYGIIHVIIGKLSFGAKKLEENYNAVLQAITDARPAGIKGDYIKSITLAPTMGPSVTIQR
jgi:large subunit ribosomal protein L1